jgi:predicted metalloprotease with PDZ domain
MIRLFTLLFCIASLPAIAQSKYTYTIDLTQVVKDRVKVTLKCPRLKESEALFVMPNVIPGSYDWKEYGRFLSEVKAFDEKGNPLKITNKKNLFYLKKDADQLDRLEYWVDDTWDDTNFNHFVFQPGGSNIEASKNFVLNFHAFVGYFDGYKNLPFEVEVIKPAEMYAATWLKKEPISQQKDLIRADTYNELVDNPTMYCKPDTTSFSVDQTRISITSYSSNGIIRSDSLSKWLKPMAFSLKNFLGKLPVSVYYFVFYFASPDQVVTTSERKGLSGYGALEHNHSSFYFLPELKDSEEVREMVQDIGSHEFLHILTPLNLHSKEIADFDFKRPTMSQHLWLYEGVTEYFSWLVRVQNQLVTEKEFMAEMTSKLRRAENYPSFSFTQMSRNVLQPAHQANYANVYQKGAVIAMLLDQLLIKESDGKYSLKQLVMDLMKKYGSQQPFDDNQLFSDILALTYPAVGDFIEDYIKGDKPLPMTRQMSAFGYEYEQQQKIDGYFIGNFSYKINDNNQFEIGEVRQNFIGLRPGDVILAVNGIAITPKNVHQVWEDYFQNNISPEKMTLNLLRDGKEIIRSGKPIPGYFYKRHVFRKFAKPSSEESRYHTIWLSGKQHSYGMSDSVGYE